MFRAQCVYHQVVKIFCTASDIITPVGDRTVSQPELGKVTYSFDDAGCCIIQF